MELGDLEFKAEDFWEFELRIRTTSDEPPYVCDSNYQVLAELANRILKEKLGKAEFVYGVMGRYGQFVMIDKSVIINSPVEQKLTARLVCIEKIK